MRLLAVQEPAPAVGLVDTQIGMMGHQNDAWSRLHVTVVGDVVIDSIGHLDPAVKDVDKIR